MSFFDDASLAFLPSGGAGKDGKAYSIKPTDGTGDFTFSRGSNLTATRVGPTGLIEKGRENLLLQSNNFDTTWVKSNQMLTPVGGQSGYDGSSDAWKIQRSDASARNIKQNVSQSGVQTFSVYAKKGNVDYISLITVGSATTKAIFSLPADGSGTNTLLDSDNISASIEYISNGWYRVSTAINESTTDVRIYPSETATAEGGVITDAFIYIQDAQLEIGLAATDYIESGASTGKAGLLENEPRFDYSGGATCPSLLLEPSRTNLVPQSEYIASWIVQSNTTVTTNTTETLSPEGLYNASKAVGNGTDGVLLSELSTAGGDNVKSVYLKGVSGGEQVVLKDPNQTNQTKTCTLTTEWQRFDLLDNQPSSFGIWIDDIPASGIYIWGAQLEQGSYPTSYIPNHSGGSATRTGEDATANISSLINTSGSVAYFEGTIQDLTGATETFRDVFALTGAGGISLRMERRITNQYYIQRSSATINSGDDFNSYSDASMNDDTIKVAFKFSSTQLKLFYNGSLMQTFDGSYNFGFTDFKFRDATTGNNITNKNNKVLIFDTALSDADCITLTT